MVVKIKISTLAAVLLAIFVIGGVVFVGSNLKPGKFLGFQSASIIQSVQAEEMYPMFLCPCCGQPLDKNNIWFFIQKLNDCLFRNIPFNKIISNNRGMTTL